MNIGMRLLELAAPIFSSYTISSYFTVPLNNAVKVKTNKILPSTKAQEGFYENPLFSLIFPTPKKYLVTFVKVFQ